MVYEDHPPVNLEEACQRMEEIIGIITHSGVDVSEAFPPIDSQANRFAIELSYARSGLLVRVIDQLMTVSREDVERVYSLIEEAIQLDPNALCNRTKTEEHLTFLSSTIGEYNPNLVPERYKHLIGKFSMDELLS
jgi:hypothetical protein